VGEALGDDEKGIPYGELVSAGLPEEKGEEGKTEDIIMVVTCLFLAGIAEEPCQPCTVV
jgi:hypothetical protein